MQLFGLGGRRSLADRYSTPCNADWIAGPMQ
jgi:hypothetical protein